MDKGGKHTNIGYNGGRSRGDSIEPITLHIYSLVKCKYVRMYTMTHTKLHAL